MTEFRFNSNSNPIISFSLKRERESNWKRKRVCSVLFCFLFSFSSFFFLMNEHCLELYEIFVLFDSIEPYDNVCPWLISKRNDFERSIRFCESFVKRWVHRWVRYFKFQINDQNERIILSLWTGIKRSIWWSEAGDDWNLIFYFILHNQLLLW